MILSNYISLLLLLLLIPMGWFWWRSLVDQEGKKKWLAIILRGLGFIFLVIALARPYWKNSNESLHVIYLVDGSQSVAPTSLKEVPDWISTSQSSLRSRDTSEVLLFAKQVKKTSLEELDLFVEQAEKGTGEADFRSATKLAEAIKTTRFFFPSEKSF